MVNLLRHLGPFSLPPGRPASVHINHGPTLSPSAPAPHLRTGRQMRPLPVRPCSWQRCDAAPPSGFGGRGAARGRPQGPLEDEKGLRSLNRMDTTERNAACFALSSPRPGRAATGSDSSPPWSSSPIAGLARASGVCLEISDAAVPLAPGVEAAALLGLDPLELALGGGEDFVLAAALPRAADLGGVLDCGRFTPTPRPGSG